MQSDPISSQQPLQVPGYHDIAQQKEDVIQNVPSYLSTEDLNNQERVAIQETSHKEMHAEIQASKEQMISLIGADHISVSRFTGEKDYLVKLKNHVKILNNGNLEYLGKGEFKTVFKINLLVKNKLMQEVEKQIAMSVTKQAITEPKPTNAYVSQLDVELSKDLAIPGRIQTVANELKMLLTTAENPIRGILPNYGVLYDAATHHFVLVTKFCNQGTLDHCFEKISQTDDEQKATLISQCWDNLANLHKAGFSHRDFKSSNILVDKNRKGELKFYLGDLGLSFKSDAKLDPGIKTNINLLPPFACGNPDGLSNPKYDNWALGLLICEMMRKANPELAFNTDAQNVGDLAHSLPWLQFCLSKNPKPEEIEKAKEQIAQFIEETFQKTALFTNEFKNLELKHLVTDLMRINPTQILDDEEVSRRVNTLMEPQPSSSP
jgi:serine/threonine protein kinase